jgi:SAM-dependent methyltransferase
MAISGTHVRLLRSLRDILPRGGSLLEIGEANWYGDVAPDFPCPNGIDFFAIAKAFYADLFAPSRIVAVDINGTPEALRQDLNGPLDLGGETFDMVINHGTAEHVFNIAQVFRSMHDHCDPGGLMVHDAPFTGWIDHGFYNLNPTLFYDLAAANCYELTLAAVENIRSGECIRLEGRDHIGRLARVGQLPFNANLFVAFRKVAAGAFRLPFQGYYNQTLSPAGVLAWENAR